MTPADVETQLARLAAGERLAPAEILQLAEAPDILTLGMLADAVRRRLHGNTVTFLRVAEWPASAGEDPRAPAAAARELRLTTTPATLDAALRSVEEARRRAAGRTVAGFTSAALRGLAESAGKRLAAVAADLRGAGLDALGEIALDDDRGADDIADALVEAGFTQLRLGVVRAPSAERVPLLLRAADIQARVGAVQTLNPLGSHAGPRPSTGYDDVKSVAIARLAAPDVPIVQVDWRRHGPKLAQVALTFGADDLDRVSDSDDAPQGRRRAPLEEVRGNIEAAGFTPVERDGRFVPLR
jgi:aminodeoxyfutalosine synthase